MTQKYYYQNFRLDRAEVEEVTRNGDEFWRVPCVALSEQVLDYSQNRRYLIPEEELKKSVPGWNGEPIVTPTHPTVNGQAITANHPDVLDEMMIGRSFNARFENDKLKFDALLNKELVRNHPRGEEIEEKITSNDVGELSTSYAVGEIEEEEGRHDGRAFNGIQRDIKPDHTAFLLDEKGNCSIEDGCGFARNADVDQVAANIRDRARTPTFEGTESRSWSDVSKTLTAVTSALNIDVDSVDEMNDEDKSRVADLTLLGESDAEVWRDLYFFPVVNHNTLDLNEVALEAVISGRGESADIPVDALESAQDMARELLNEQFDRDLETNTEANMDEEEKQSFYSYMKSFFVEELDDEGPATNEAEESLESNSSSNSGNCQCEDDMDELIQKIASNSDWEESELKDFGEAQLEKLENTVTAEAETEEEEESEADEETESEADASSSEEEADTVEVPKQEWDSVTDTVSELQETVEEQNEMLQNVREQRESKRQQYISTIVNNSGNFDEERLKDFSTEDLKDLAAELSPNFYGGQAGNAGLQESAQDDATIDSPSVLVNEDEEE